MKTFQQYFPAKSPKNAWWRRLTDSAPQGIPFLPLYEILFPSDQVPKPLAHDQLLYCEYQDEFTRYWEDVKRDAMVGLINADIMAHPRRLREVLPNPDLTGDDRAHISRYVHQMQALLHEIEIALRRDAEQPTWRLARLHLQSLRQRLNGVEQDVLQ